MSIPTKHLISIMCTGRCCNRSKQRVGDRSWWCMKDDKPCDGCLRRGNDEKECVEKLMWVKDEEEVMDYKKLSSSEVLEYCGVDAQKWAQAFMQIVVEGKVPIDEGLMIGWFANSIEKGKETLANE